eukprot:scaffold44108_cov79-Attheya_sp.AAC.1
MKIVKAESLFLFLTVLLVGQATSEFTFIELDEEGSEGENLREGSKWGAFGYDFCIEPVRKKVGSRFRLTKCEGKNLPTRNQQFRFREDSDNDYYYFAGKLEWRGQWGGRKWCVDVKDELKGGNPWFSPPAVKVTSQGGSRILIKPGPLISSSYASSREQMEKKVTLSLSPIATKMVAHGILKMGHFNFRVFPERK